MDIYNLVSFVGIFILLGLAWLLSANRRNVNYMGSGFTVYICGIYFSDPSRCQILPISK